MTRSLIARVLERPALLSTMSLGDWDTLIRQARTADVLARVAHLAEHAGIWEAMPAAPRQHLHSARVIARAQHAEVMREVRHIRRALAPLNVPIVLLKGAAYVVGQLPAAIGRGMTDIDIMVPRSALADAESQLMLAGWHTTHHDPYDQRYYREWMHELPPMVHGTRGTAIDVHHAILPVTAAFKPASSLLMAASVELHGHPGLRVLAPIDRILHAATHLLCNEEVSHGLRDLSDIDLMLCDEHERDRDFWPALIERAAQLDVSVLLAHALRHAVGILGTPVPTEVMRQASERAWQSKPSGRFTQPLMNWVLQRGLDSLHRSARKPGTSTALSLQYIRAHALRMPPTLLVRHLSIKAWKRLLPGKQVSNTILKA